MLHRGGAFRFSRSQGLSGDSGWIDVPMRNFELMRAEPKLSIFFRKLRKAGPTGEGTVVRDPLEFIARPAFEARIPDGESIDIVGELVLDGGNDDIVRIPDIYLAPSGLKIQEPTEEGGDGPIVRIELVSVQYFWGRRGTPEPGYWNVPKVDGTPGFEPGSFNLKTGRPWRLKERLEYYLSRLPGQPEIGRFPDALAEVEPIGGEVTGGELAVALIFDLAEAYGLRPVLDLMPAGTVSFWPKDTGAIGEGVDNLDSFRREALVESNDAVGFGYPPAAVEVIGGPNVREHYKTNLEPVGLKEGKVVPLEEALLHYGFNLDNAGEWVLQRPEDRARGRPLDDTAALESFAFKWYQLPQAGRRRYLPIQNLVETDEAGRRLAPLVRASRYSELPEPDDLTPEQQAMVAEGLGDIIAYTRGTYYLSRLDEEVFRTEREIKLAEKQLAAFGKPEGAEELREKVALEERLASLRQALIAAKAPIAGPGYNPSSSGKFVNLPVHDVNPSEYELDRDLGIVKFKEPRGELAFLGVDQVEKSRLKPGFVEMHFAAEDKPDLSSGPEHPSTLGSYRWRYCAIWSERSGMRRVDRFDEDVSVTPVEAADLVLHQRINGASNEAQLTQASEKIARSLLAVPRFSVGRSLLFASFRTVNCNGRVKSVSWSSDGRTAITSVQAGPGGQGAGATSRQLRRVYEDEQTVARPPAGWSTPGPDENRSIEEQVAAKGRGRLGRYKDNDR